MKQAIQIQGGMETLVTADQTKLLFQGKRHPGAQWKCYRCGQRVIPVAMGTGYLVSPHFKHEKNNEQAQECELFEARGGTYSTYASRHSHCPAGIMPMYIEKKPYRAGVFEMGFELYALLASTAERLMESNAKLYVCGKRYDLSTDSMPYVTTRIPCPATLTPHDCVKLVADRKISLEKAWGIPESSKRFLLFECAEDFSYSKIFANRIHAGYALDPDATLVIAAPRWYKSEIKADFPTANLVGYADTREGRTPFDVYKLDLDRKGYELTNGYKALRDAGFIVPSLNELPAVSETTAHYAGGYASKTDYSLDRQGLVNLLDDLARPFENMLTHVKEGCRFSALVGLLRNPKTSSETLSKAVEIACTMMNAEWDSGAILFGRDITKVAFESISNVARNPNTPANTLYEIAGFVRPDGKLGYSQFSLIQNPRIPTELLSSLISREPDRLVLSEIARSAAISQNDLERLSQHEESSVREGVAKNPNTPCWVLEKLLDDSYSLVRDEALGNQNMPFSVLELHLDKKYGWERDPVAKNPSLPSYILRLLSYDEWEDVRKGVAENPSTPVEVLERLYREEGMRRHLAINPATPVYLLNRIWEGESVPLIDKLIAFSKNPNTTANILEKLSHISRVDVGLKAQCEDPYERNELSFNVSKLRIAEHPNTPYTAFASLAECDKGYVVEALFARL